MNVETTPAREECQGFQCPNDNEEGGLFQVEIYLGYQESIFILFLGFFLYLYQVLLKHQFILLFLLVGTMQPRIL